MLIRECSGIVCLPLADEKIRELDLPLMTEHNTNHHGTAFTVSIEARDGVTRCLASTGSPGPCGGERRAPRRALPSRHIFPLRACPGECLRGEGTRRYGGPDGPRRVFSRRVLCELTNPDGTMARLPEVVAFAEANNMGFLSIEDIVQYRLSALEKTG